MIVELITRHADHLTRVGLHFLWQGTAIAILAALISRFLINAPRNRSALHLLGLIALSLCVPVTWMVLEETPAAAAFQPALSQSMPQELAAPIAIESGSQIPPTQNHLPLAVWIVGLYLTGLLLMLIRVLRGYQMSHQIRRNGKPVIEAHWVEALSRAVASMKLRSKPVMIWSQKVTSPVVTGILRPMIVLPMSLMSGLPREQAIAVLSHELAHLRRFDHFIVVFQRLLEALFFFHPAIWFLSRRLDQEREKACDDLVVKAGHKRADYAEALITLASDHQPALTLAAAKNTHLKERILRILNHPQPTTVQVNRSGWLTIAAAIGGLGFLSLSPALSEEKEVVEEEKVEEVNPGRAVILKKLEMKIPLIDFNQVTLTETIEFLRLRSIELDPNKNGINFVVQEKLNENAPFNPIIDRLKARNFTFVEALEAICMKAKFKYVADEFSITLVPLAEDEIASLAVGGLAHIVQRAWRTADNFRQFIAADGVPPESLSVEDHLKALGVEFGPGSSASLLLPSSTRSSTTLIVRNTPINLELLDGVVAASGPPKGEVEPAKEKEAPAVAPDPILNTLIIPEIKLENSTLAEAVEFLRIRSQELDPAKEGVNINIFSDERDLSKEKIKSLHLTNAPLRVVIQYLCEESKTRYTLEGRNISILPREK